MERFSQLAEYEWTNFPGFADLQQARLIVSKLVLGQWNQIAMNRLLQALAVGTLLLANCAGSPVHANLITVINMAADDTSVSGFNVTGALVGNTYTFTLTQTGNLDGGTVNDTLSFDLIYETYTGSTFSGGDVTLGTASTPNVNNQNWHSSLFTTGDTLSLEVANISYTDGEGDETLAFNGFTSIRPTSFTSASNSTPAGDIDYYVGLTGATTITDDPTFVADLIASNGTSPSLFFTASNGPVRLRDLSFQFQTSAAPEPSSIALVFSGIGLLVIRRRRRTNV